MQRVTAPTQYLTLVWDWTVNQQHRSLVLTESWFPRVRHYKPYFHAKPESSCVRHTQWMEWVENLTFLRQTEQSVFRILMIHFCTAVISSGKVKLNRSIIVESRGLCKTEGEFLLCGDGLCPKQDWCFWCVGGVCPYNDGEVWNKHTNHVFGKTQQETPILMTTYSLCCCCWVILYYYS